MLRGVLILMRLPVRISIKIGIIVFLFIVHTFLVYDILISVFLKKNVPRVLGYFGYFERILYDNIFCV